MRPALGLVTIGQSPRTDLIPDLLPVLGDTPYVEHGALDDLAPGDLAAAAPPPGEPVLTSRLRDGSSVLLGHDALRPLLGTAVSRCADDGAAVVLILCTGHLDGIPGPVPVLYAEPLAQAGARALVGAGRLGVISPLADQVDAATARWTAVMGDDVVGANANPYTDDDAAMAAAATRLTSHGAQWVFLDCIGYTEQHRSAASAAGVPTLLARSIAARLAVEAARAVGVLSR